MQMARQGGNLSKDTDFCVEITVQHSYRPCGNTGGWKMAVKLGPLSPFPPKIRSDVALGGGDRSFGAMRGFYVVRKSTRPDPLIHSSNGAADINCDAVGMG